jgi:cation diffusion facilitator CzcD-associated flavoprotein CzcO
MTPDDRGPAPRAGVSERVTGRLDALIVGAGFAGLYMLHRLRSMGFSARVLERASGIGGTWFWNRYPGARCDVESLEYSYQFSDELQQDWQWSERYATQPEILRYIEHVADRFELRRDIQLDTRVVAAVYDDTAHRWHVDTQTGERFEARFCVMATGCLSSTNLPDFRGLDRFAGSWYHTGDWPHEGVDFSGQRVGVIGTGSSAIQSIPLIARQARHLHVFQRTPNFSVPAHNRPLDAGEQRRLKADYAGLRERAGRQPFGFDTGFSEVAALSISPQEREREYEARWARGGLAFLGAFGDLFFDAEANRTAAEFVRGKICALVSDPEVAALLAPEQVIGCKRLCVDTDYYATFNRPNVTLVDVSAAPIEEITATGVRTADAYYELDALVFATGFDAMTGSLLRIDIRGHGGLRLQDAWAEGPRTYLGLATAGFPNLFMITGPGSPSVLTNMLPSIEQHVNWIAGCILELDARGGAAIEVLPQAQEDWVAHVNDVAAATLLQGCNSWYLGANVPGKPRIFMPLLGYPEYVAKCEEVVAKGYEGFAIAS